MNKDVLLCKLLNCKQLDLDMLCNMNIDIDEIIEYSNESIYNEFNTFHSIIKYHVEILLNNIQSKIDEKKENFGILTELIIQGDVREYYNYLDTNIKLINNIDIYQKYFQEELNYFKDNTNLSLI